MEIIEIIIFAYFFYVVGYTAFFSVAAFGYHIPKERKISRQFSFCVLIPAYKEDHVIIETVKRTIDQSYRPDRIVVIADSLLPTTLSALAALPIEIVKVEFDKSTKVKSLVKALELQTQSFDYGVILDADNIPEYRFFEKLNNLLCCGNFKAVQCQRKPKNENNELAFLDGLSEAINNHIYRQGATALGLSSSISGSGVAVDFNLLKEKLTSMTSVGGFDRELELQLLAANAKVFYYKDAMVLDEKVSDTNSFENQRKRWISSQYFYLSKYFLDGVAAFIDGDFSFFNSAIARNIQLPRLINLGLLTVLTVFLFPFRDHLFLDYIWWPALLGINLFAILLAIPRKAYTVSLFKSLTSVPAIFFRMLMLLFKLRKANTTFIHTPHTFKHASHE